MSAAAVVVETTAAKGRGLVAARDVEAGEAVADELPILLSLYDDAKDLACARCLRALDGGGGGGGGNGAGGAQSGGTALPCASCRQVAFCSGACAAAAASEPWVHAPETCRAYAAGLAALPEARASAAAAPGASGASSAAGAAAAAAAAAADEAATEARSSLRFLIQALALRALAQQQQHHQQHQHQQQPRRPTAAEEGAVRYVQLLSLCGAGGDDASAAAASAARALMPALAAAVGAAAMPPEAEVAALLAREQANSFAVQAPGGFAGPLDAPPAPAAAAPAAAPRSRRPRRRLLGGALYALASLVNHECLPNVARFDDFARAASAPPDTPAERGRLRLVALHALPRGAELALSYVPLRWNRAARRAHCRAVYGFECACARCALEAREDVFGAARGGPPREGEEGGSGGEWETDEGEEGSEWEEGEEEEEEQGGGEGGTVAMEVEEEEERAVRPGEAPSGQSGAMEPTYLHLFLLKYACARRGCTGGTLAPASSARGADAAAAADGGAALLRCNACGGERTEAQFLAELQGAGGRSSPGR